MFALLISAAYRVAVFLCIVMGLVCFIHVLRSDD